MNDGIVTLEHGTSEGLLASILRNGFQPFTTDVEQHTRNIMNHLLPGVSITDDLVEQGMRSAGGRGHRDAQSQRGERLFACLGPNSSGAQKYAADNAQNGGEYATRLFNVLSGNPNDDPRLNGIKPVFDGARPVVISFAIPRSEVGEQIPATPVSEYPPLANHAVMIGDTSRIKITGVTFGAKGPDGKWTFEGQPTLSPDAALAEINDKFKPERNIFKSRFAHPTAEELAAAAPVEVDPKIAKIAADVEKWVGKNMADIKPHEKALALVSLQSQQLIDGLVAPESIAAEAARIAKNLQVIVRDNPEAAVSMCCSIMNHPKLGMLTSIAATTYNNSMYSIAYKDPMRAHMLGGIHMEVYGGHNPAIAKAATPFAAPKQQVSLSRPERKTAFAAR